MNDKITKIIDEVSVMTILEVADLVKALEEKFGVSAQMAVAATPTAVESPTAEAGEEQTTFNVVLTAAGANKISVIKAVREVVPTLGLAEAKTLVESAPKEVLTGVNKATAEEAKKKLEAVGATAELK
ncbi:MAG: 50S ribosomal protein L7/L12 [Patescibacteria group bacterium]